MYIEKTSDDTYTSYYFGKRKVWLNPEDEYCMAALTWIVVVRISKKEKEERAYLEAEWSANEDARTHSVYRMGDLRPIQRVNRETHQFELAVKQALQWCENEGIELARWY